MLEMMKSWFEERILVRLIVSLVGGKTGGVVFNAVSKKATTTRKRWFH